MKQDAKIIKGPSNQPLVALGVPCGDRVHKEFAETLWALGRGARHHRQGLVCGQSSMVTHARDQVVEGAMKIGADYLMFLDSDMICPWDTIDRLLAHSRDIVGATYVRRGPPFDNLGHALLDSDRGASRGLVEMTHIPTGMLLIKMSVFAKFKRPFFRFEIDEAAGISRGEDFVFSEMARAADFKLWCDIDLSKEVGHSYQYLLRTEDPMTRKIAESYKDAVNG